MPGLSSVNSYQEIFGLVTFLLICHVEKERILIVRLTAKRYTQGADLKSDLERSIQEQKISY